MQDTLPAHAQEIFKEAYSSAWKRYDKQSKRRENASREKTSMKVAWAAVKKTYEKSDGDWVAKKE